MTFESANHSTQPASIESTAGKTAAGGGDQAMQIALVECWPGGPIVSSRGQCPGPGGRDRTRVTPELPMLPQATVGTNAIDFGSSHSRAMTMAANEKAPEPMPRPMPIQPPVTYNRPYRINGDGTVEMGVGPTTGPGSWQNPNNK